MRVLDFVENMLPEGLAAAAVVAVTLDQVLAPIPATLGDDRVLAVIRDQAERVARS